MLCFIRKSNSTAPCQFWVGRWAPDEGSKPLDTTQYNPHKWRTLWHWKLKPPTSPEIQQIKYTRHDDAGNPAPNWTDTYLNPADPTRPSEPILSPMLRIQFVDFLYLHCSIASGCSPIFVDKVGNNNIIPFLYREMIYDVTEQRYWSKPASGQCQAPRHFSEFPGHWGPPDHGKILLPWNLSEPRPSSFSLEYLLLTPGS